MEEKILVWPNGEWCFFDEIDEVLKNNSIHVVGSMVFDTERGQIGLLEEQRISKRDVIYDLMDNVFMLDPVEI